MDRKLVEAEILLLAADILMSKTEDSEIKRVTALAKDNDCLDILQREFKSIDDTLHL